MNDRLDTSVDLTNCDREPIHIPGAIQPHGVLLALQEPGLIVSQASENTATVFQQEVAQVLQRPLSSLLPAQAFAAVQAATKRSHLAEGNPLPMTISGLACDAVLHRHQGALILEIEPRTPTATSERTHHPLRSVVARLQAAATLAELLTNAAEAVSRLTAFERVMIYSFDEDGHGSVDAEVKREDFEPYLGLHYPASDIPRQARELYLRNAIRSIPDARYTPVALRPSLRPDTGAPLDLSFANLRSVSPIHLEYLANMGIRASLSVSLVVRDRLWGLISCAHHSGPHYLPYEVRSDCEVVGRMMSLLIGAFEDRAVATGRERRKPLLDALAKEMRDADDALAALVKRPDELFALLRIDGAAIVREDIHTVGTAPPTAAVRGVSQWLQQAHAPGVFTTAALSKAAPEFTAIKDTASGVVSFAVPGAVPRRFIGFRPEIVQTVDWGGDPRKAVEQDGMARLHPRRSFALWRERVRERSHPWTPSDREAAEELRQVVVEVDLERQVEREQRAVRARDDLVAVVSHDLKNPLHVIQMQSVLLGHIAGGGADERSVRLRASLDRIQRSVGRMDALIHDLLDLARIEAGRFDVLRRAESLEEMLAEALIILRPLAEAKGVVLDEQAETRVMVLADRERIFQVLSNVVGNAIKFTPTGGRIALRATVERAHAVVSVTDTGPGLSPEQALNVFNRYWQAKTGHEGSGLGLYIAKGIVEAHGGRIWAERADAGGATFKFTLPLAETAASST
jgi:light-regulated signal transduction histidine kinase (bacteriophytochrome)